VVANATREKAYREQFVALVQSYLPRLNTLYDSGMPEADMRREKAALFDTMRQDYAVMKADWQGYNAYDPWFADEINNAKINTIGTYFNHVPAFDALLVESGGDLPTFYTRVAELGTMSREDRHARLESLGMAD